MEEGVGHPQGLEDALTQELVKGLVRNDLDDASQGVKSGAGAVGPLRAWLEVKWRGTQAGNIIGQLLARLPGHSGNFGAARSAAAGQAGDMGQQILDGNLAGRRNRVDLGRRRIS